MTGGAGLVGKSEFRFSQRPASLSGSRPCRGFAAHTERTSL